MNEATDEQKIWIVELRHIQPSKTNPRTHFPEEKINELADSIREIGVRSALWVRPLWCVGWDGKNIEQRRPGEDLGKGFVALDQPFEIIAGECRYRGALLAERENVPCQILEVSDARALELQLIENLQRSDLDPIEEANGYRNVLDLKDPATGKPVHTVDSIAKKVGRTPKTIYERLKLLKAPTVAMEAVLSGRISPSTAAALGRIPDEAQREQAAARVVTHSMSFEATEELIGRDYMKSLSVARFDITAPRLLEDAPACAECPHLAKNNPEFAARPRSGDTCLNPACYQRKTDAAFEAFRLAQSGDGRRVLTQEENRSAIENENFRTWSSNIVPLDQKPNSGQLRNGAVNTKTWRQLIEGRGVEVVVGRLNSGAAIEGVDVKLAIAAAKENGHQIFPVASSVDRSNQQDQQKKDLVAKTRRKKVALDIAGKIVKASSASKTTEGAWLRLLVFAVLRSHLGNMVADRTGLKLKALIVDAQAKDPAKVAGSVGAVLFGLGFDWHWNPDSHLKDLLKKLGFDFSKQIRDLVTEDQAKEREAAQKAAANAIAKNRPDPYIIEPEREEKPAEITFDRKTLLFRVKDQPGWFEATPRTAFCRGWNDQREGKKRDLEKVPRWCGVHREAYRYGFSQAKDKTAWPEMSVVEDYLVVLLGKAAHLRKDHPGGVTIFVDKLKVDLDTAEWISDALVDAAHDAKASTAVTTGATHRTLAKKPAAVPVAKVAAKPKAASPPAGSLKERILDVLAEAGHDGMHVKEISAKLGVKMQNVHVWFSTTGRKTAGVQKVGEARYALTVAAIEARKTSEVKI